MSFNIPRKRKTLTSLILTTLVLFIGISFGFLRETIFSDNAQFQRFTYELYKEELSSNLLSLHYALAYPEKKGISRPPATLGTIPTDFQATEKKLASYEKKLQSFPEEKLSLENQITRDALLLSFHTQHSLKDCFLLEEYLSPSLGIQAQLPILLAEYPFYKMQDITDYLKLLCNIRSYFEQILAFEQQKVNAGCFMSDTTLDRILKQCQAFIDTPESNYMLEIFPQKLQNFGHFSTKERSRLEAIHKKLILEQVIPAYQYLITELSLLRGSGTNLLGLKYYENGQKYYEYLIKSQVGIYDSIDILEKKLALQMYSDCNKIQQILHKHPEFLSQLSDSSFFPVADPDEILSFLKEKSLEDFPAVSVKNWEVRYVSPSLEKYLSPAFYLTPPFDTGSPNIIYLNPSGNLSGLDLFITLAHEGFPGHLYQSVSYINSSPSLIRSILNFNGYCEGWATYIEAYAFEYAADFFKEKASPSLTLLAWLNRSVNLCLYSMIDIGIHYRGWNLDQTKHFLQGFGITDPSIIKEIFQYILETPANYLKYYGGYLALSELKNLQETKLGTNFSLLKFHQTILDIGPVPFPVLKKYL